MAESRPAMVTKGGFRDTITGAVVLLVAAILFGLVYAKEDGPRKEATNAGYLVKARFNKADGIAVGSDVRLSGVSVGKVVEASLAPDFRAVMVLRVAPNLVLTADTLAAIHTDGLLGAKYIELKPGGDDRTLKPGDEIPFTQDAMVLEELLEMIIQQGRAKRGLGDQKLPNPAAD